jgi:UDP-N-acetylmuramoylalanine--D-glutamate ligase
MSEFVERLRHGTSGGTRVLIAGFGAEGQSVARFLAQSGCRITVHDKKDENGFSGDIIEEFSALGVEFRFGGPLPDGDYDVVVRSPGVPPEQLAVHTTSGQPVPVTTSTNIFFALCLGQVIGVTGTKGKGTTASLVAEMLRAAKKDVVLGGNIGTPMLELLPKIQRDTTVVLELSSFQLVDAEASPHIAVVLMVTEDHLDFHPTVEAYVKAKMPIAMHQGVEDAVVYNADYPSSVRIGTVGKGMKYEVSAQHAVGRGCFIEGSNIIIAGPDGKRVIASVGDLRLPGRHNWENACAAALAASLAGASDDALREGMRTFTGLEHRLELVREVNGVKYYNDSFATNPSSTIAAIRAFYAPEVLILGGSPKGSDFSELAQVVAERRANIRAIIGIGEEWARVKEAFLKAGVTSPFIEEKRLMKDIVFTAAGAAKMGDVVLLSPACASFGLFTDYKDRGAQFKRAVMEL